MTLKRITITIPEEVADAADELAAHLDRSRSWVLSDAARQGLELQRPVPGRSSGSAARRSLDEGLDPSRRTQLESDLEMTPTGRVLAAERTGRLSHLLGDSPRRDRVILFDSYEDYLDWDARDGIRPL